MTDDYRYYHDINGKWTVQHYMVQNNYGYWYDLPRQCDVEQDAIDMIKRLRASDGFKPVMKYVENDNG